MTRRDKVGLGILVGLFAFLIALLIYAFHPLGTPVSSPEDSAFVKQRMINLQKSKQP